MPEIEEKLKQSKEDKAWGDTALSMLEHLVDTSALTSEQVADAIRVLFPKHAENLEVNSDVHSLLVDLLFLSVWNSRGT